MDFSTMQQMVALSVGNMKPSHPLHKWIGGDAATSTPSVINMAANRFIRMQPEKFPELKATWTVGPTWPPAPSVGADNEIELPFDLLVVYEVASARSSVYPAWGSDKTYPIQYVSNPEFDLLDKSASSDYARICTKVGKVVKIWPTPDTDHVDYMMWYGIMAEPPLINATDELFMSVDWHPLVCRLAASILLEMRGNIKRSKELLNSVREEIGGATDLVAEENLGNSDAITVQGAPTRSTVYG